MNILCGLFVLQLYPDDSSVLSENGFFISI